MTAPLDPAGGRFPSRLGAFAQAWGPRLFVLCLTALTLWLGPRLLTLPIPDSAVQLTQARLMLQDRPAHVVDLPHRWSRRDTKGPAQGVYALDLPPLDPNEPMVLLLPSVRLGLSARLDGRPLPRDTPQMTGTGAGSTIMLRLPPGTTGGRLELILTRNVGMVPGYLSPVYLVRERDIDGASWLWAIGDGVLRMAALAVHLLMAIAVLVVWTARRRDPVFGWLVVLGLGSLLNVLWSVFAGPRGLGWTQSYMSLIASGLGLAVMALSMAVIDRPRPRWLKVAVFALPAALMLGMASGLTPPGLWSAIAFLIAIAGNLAGAFLLLGVGLKPTEWDRLLLAAPFLLTACFGLRDVAVLFGLISDPFLMTSYVRTLTIVAVLALLMRRLAVSLNGLDAANETQRRRLREQEVELNRLHHDAQARMTLATREEERRRLMRDLHDGVSGHLVSIIALAERPRVDRKAIEAAARGALEDLRLVVNSLDLEDGDLRLALAGFRERLAPQLRRLGVSLDWSMEDLPEIGGVTPATALSILRILQEAVTNALKHGPASRIALRGEAGPDGAVLTVTNDCLTPETPGRERRSRLRRTTGHGLYNMHQRAQTLGGGVRLQRQDDHAVLILSLPERLAES